MARLGTGIGWRPEIAAAVERMPGIDWVEAVAENVCPEHLPDSLRRLVERGVTVVPHGVGLGLGDAGPPEEERLVHLAACAEALGSPLVTEHIAFVRAGGPVTASPRLEAGHLLPVPRTRDALDVLCENVRAAQQSLPVPLAVENIAALFTWPDEEMTEGQFLYDLVDRTGVRLLIDVANLHTNHVNRGEEPSKALDELPVEAIAYVHVAGGVERDGVWHDSHAHPVPPAVLDILADLASRVTPPGVLLERDENFPEPVELEAELRAIRETVGNGAHARVDHVPAGVGTTTATPDAARGARGDEGPAGGATAGRDTAGDVEPHGGTRAGGTSDKGVPQSWTPLSDDVRQRLAIAQAALLSSLVAGAPAPEGFDRGRLAVQSRALAGKRADVVGKVAPELPGILGERYRPEFLAYAHAQPMTGGYRRDALDFAEHVLAAGGVADAVTRRRLTSWWLERSGPKPPSPHPVARLVRAARTALHRV